MKKQVILRVRQPRLWKVSLLDPGRPKPAQGTGLTMNGPPTQLPLVWLRGGEKQDPCWITQVQIPASLPSSSHVTPGKSHNYSEPQFCINKTGRTASMCPGGSYVEIRQGLARHKGSSLCLPCCYYSPGLCDIQWLTYASRSFSVKWEQG